MGSNALLSLVRRFGAKSTAALCVFVVSVLLAALSAGLSLSTDKTRGDSRPEVSGCTGPLSASPSLAQEVYEKLEDVLAGVKQRLDVVISIPEDDPLPSAAWAEYMTNLTRGVHRVRVFTNRMGFRPIAGADYKYFRFDDIRIRMNFLVGDRQRVLVTSSFCPRNNSLNFYALSVDCASAAADLSAIFESLWEDRKEREREWPGKRRWINEKGFPQVHESTNKRIQFVLSPFESFPYKRTNVSEALMDIMGDDKSERIMFSKRIFQNEVKTYQEAMSMSQVAGFFEVNDPSTKVQRKLIVSKTDDKVSLGHYKSLIPNMGENDEFYFSEYYDIECSIACDNTDTLFITGTIDEVFNNYNFVLGVLYFNSNICSSSNQCKNLVKKSTKVEIPVVSIFDA